MYELFGIVVVTKNNEAVYPTISVVSLLINFCNMFISKNKFIIKF